MKQLKWEVIKLTQTQKEDAFSEEHSLNRSRARMQWLLSEYSEIYESWSGDWPASQLANEVLNFGGSLARFGISPTLLAMNVPFHVRRQTYEYYLELGDVIHHSLNSDDTYFNLWAEAQRAKGRRPISKATMARNLWQWYYGVFEPIARRFVTFGSEHVGINLK